MLINQLAFVPVERFHDKQVDCHATVPGVAGRFAQAAFIAFPEAARHFSVIAGHQGAQPSRVVCGRCLSAD